MVSQILTQIVLKIEKTPESTFQEPLRSKTSRTKKKRLKTNGKHVNNIFIPQFGD
jgi:hypothetical protein